ncbi:MAG: segregation/condensation protein A [Gemmatimonadetes bacterium]|nr:segregation/condensation protein A [Gemmatimonadota bacterium]
MSVRIIDTSSDKPFVVELDSFSGPLDLLLHLIREQEIDIADIPIASVADQFFSVIRDLGLNQAAEYLEMAARLLTIKIQMLLPRSLDDDEWEDPRAALVRRLLEYEQIREVTDWLLSRASARAEQFPRGWVPPPPDPLPPEIVIDLEQVVRAVEEVIEGMVQPVIHRVVPRPLDVEGATARIRAMLAGRQRLDFSELVGERPHVSVVMSMLIALLELARLGEARITQAKPFEELRIIGEPSHEAG